MRRVAVGAALVVVAIVVSVVVIEQRTQPAAPSIRQAEAEAKIDETGWEQLQKRRDQNGRWTLDGALLTFGYVFEPLPGAPVPAGLTPDPRLLSGSSAMFGVLSHWNELTPEQRRVVGRYLADEPAAGGSSDGDTSSGTTTGGHGPGTTAPVAAPDTPAPWITAQDGSTRSKDEGPAVTRPPVRAERHLAGSDVAMQGGAFDAIPTAVPSQALRDRLEVELRSIAQGEAQKLGMQFNSASYINIHLRLTDGPKLGDKVMGAWMAPRTASSLITADDTSYDLSEGVQACEVYVMPSQWTTAPPDGKGGIPWGLVMVLAHEAFHCMQAFGMGTSKIEDFLLQPQWVIEGGAEWAGFTYPGLAPDGWWDEYLTSPAKPLWNRDYDGLGVFYLTEQLGRPLWPAWVSIWTNVTGPNHNTTDWFNEVTDTAQGAFIDAWGSSFYRQPSWGTDWDYTSPTVTNTVELPAGIGGPKTEGVIAYSTLQRDVTSAPDDVLIVSSTVPMRYRDEGGLEEIGVSSFELCVRGDCTCPDGSTNTDALDTATLPIHVAADALDKSGTVTFAFKSATEHCKDKPLNKPSGGGAGGGAGGGGGGGGGSGSGSGGPGGGGPGGGQSGPPCGAGCGGSNGDPHLTTLDGLRYDEQAAGELTLLRSTGTDAGPPFTIQVRQQPWDRSRLVSVNRQVAVKVGEDRYTVVAGQNGLTLRHNGSELTLTDDAARTASISVKRVNASHAPGFGFVLADGTEVWTMPIGPHGINVQVGVSQGRAGKVEGLLGNGNGDREDDLVDGSGSALGDHPDGERLRTSFADRWRVTAANTALDYQPGETTETFTDRSFPDRPTSPQDVADRSRAEAVCRANGVTQQPVLDDCILDVGVTGKPAFARALAIDQAVRLAGARQRFRRSGLVFQGEERDPVTRDEYQFEGEQGQLVFFGASGQPCDDGGLDLELIGPDGTSLLDQFGCRIGRYELPQDGTYAVRMDGLLRTGRYRIPMVPIRPDVVRDARIGDVLTGHIPDRGTHDIFVVHADAGQKLEIAAPDCVDPGLAVQVVAPSGQVVGGGSGACRASTDLPETGDYRIIVNDAELGTGDYRLPLRAV